MTNPGSITDKQIALGGPAEETAILDRHHIASFCADENTPTSTGAGARIPSEVVLSEPRRTCSKDDRELPNWNILTLDTLTQHIVLCHHGFLREELPAIERAIAKAVELRAGTKATALVSLERTFRFFKRELELHLRKEEEVLFPLIRRLEVASSTSDRLPRFPFGSIANPIGIMEEDHDTEKRQLEKMLALTRNYSGPPETATICRLLFERLQSLNADMKIHVHLENDVLFPRVSTLENESW
jgi:regulator of cell morphogenesis and NO signaling